MSAWLARLKNQNPPGPHPTKPTKLTKDAHSGGFVGFVAYPQGGFQKIEGAVVATPAPAPAPPEPPAFDPGHPALLALAMAYCDAIHATDKAREDWREDVRNTPPLLRQGLYIYLRDPLREPHLLWRTP